MALEFTQAELDAFRSEMFRGFTPAQFELCISECKRRNLVPGQHIHYSLRSSKEFDPDLKQSVFVKKIVRIVTIDAMRLIAQRTGEYEGQGKGLFYYLDANDMPVLTSTVPLPDPANKALPREPWAASIPIYRKGFREPLEVVARFEAYAQTRKSGDDIVLTEVWSKRSSEMLLKCSTVAALRAGFPEELGSLYIHEEMDRDDRPEMPQSTAETTVPAPQAPVVPAVNNAPVQPTSDPRPNEPQPTITDLILDRTPAPEEAKPVPVEKKTPAPKTAKDIVTAAIKEPVVDGEPLPNEAERKATGEQIRSYTASPKIVMDHLKAFILKKTGFAETKLIPQKKWLEVLAEVDAAFKKSPETLRDLINPPAPPQTEEEPF